MKAADKLSALRIILAPVFFIIYFIPRWNPAGIVRYFPGFSAWSVPVLWLIFVVSALTDMFDGMVARRRKEVSDFGKLFDPFADTLAQLTYFLCFVLDGIFPAVFYIVVIYREFGILFLRNLMLRKGVAMGARMAGKIKTVAYISACALALLAVSVRRIRVLRFGSIGLVPVVSTAAAAVFAVSAALAVFSFADYVRVYRAAK
ncbi:MAG: CDP-diacylglycerol--glycerol-3-phosphate 3-phosphatidyltransferase [Treponema sp.]|jgi:CDP-diacylglycerol--glycerol-3-phosphate 3-phosphatidyltransferase|nr:CDP-diacylglycerol--glycerol-3-phosphate 3-phosphatidyltransferase [Treponema sp.]